MKRLKNYIINFSHKRTDELHKLGDIYNIDLVSYVDFEDDDFEDDDYDNNFDYSMI